MPNASWPRSRRPRPICPPGSASRPGGSRWPRSRPPRPRSRPPWPAACARIPALTLLLRQTRRDEGLSSVRWGEVEVALVDDWTGGLAGTGAGVLQFYPLLRDPMVLVVPRGHPLADPAEPVDLRKLSETSRWMAAPAGEPSRQAVDRLLAAAGGVPAMPWEFEGLGTIMSLVSRGIGVAAVPRLALAAGEGRVVVRELPGAEAGPGRIRGGPHGQRPRGPRSPSSWPPCTAGPGTCPAAAPCQLTQHHPATWPPERLTS